MNMLKINDRVICFAPAGWGGQQPDLIKSCFYDGKRLNKNGFPIHGMLYRIRGVDNTCNIPAVYLTGIRGTIRKDGTEMSFAMSGFMKPADFRAAESKLKKQYERKKN